MSLPNNVFLVDDDEAIRKSTARALSKRGYDVETFASAEDFLAAFSQGWIGCVVLDLRMPGMSGLDLQKRIAESGQALSIVFITGHGSIEQSVEAMKNGAIDFLVKPFRPATLIERIDEAMTRSQKIASDLSQQADLRARFDRLTGRELEIAALIVSDPSRTSSKDIARYLGISARTADHHRARIFEKTGLNSVAELVNAALRCDLLSFVDVPEPGDFKKN